MKQNIGCAECTPGPYVVSGRWSGRLVKHMLSDLILSGQRTFLNNLHQLVYATGKHRPRPNPDGPEMKVYLELAHITAAEHDVVLAGIKAREEESGKVQKSGKNSPLW